MVVEFNINALDAIESEIIRVGNETLYKIAQAAYYIVPYKSGTLADNIDVLKEFSPGSLSGTVGIYDENEAFYWPFVHFGTRYMAARPFLTQAFDQVAPDFLNNLGRSTFSLSAPRYSFPRNRKQYTYLRPGQAPPDRARNYLPVTPGRRLQNYIEQVTRREADPSFSVSPRTGRRYYSVRDPKTGRFVKRN